MGVQPVGKGVLAGNQLLFTGERTKSQRVCLTFPWKFSYWPNDLNPVRLTLKLPVVYFCCLFLLLSRFPVMLSHDKEARENWELSLSLQGCFPTVSVERFYSLKLCILLLMLQEVIRQSNSRREGFLNRPSLQTSFAVSEYCP